MACALGLLVLSLMAHSAWVVTQRLSAPAIAVTARLPNGTRVTFEDFRESYAWLAANTPSDARVLAWRDYGHAIRTLANRTTVIDSAALSATHTSDAARLLVGGEAPAADALRRLGVGYVLVVFGGKARYAQDDLGKMAWMVRIAAAGGRNSGCGAARSLPAEAAYYGTEGGFRVDRHAPEALTQSLVYRLSYHRFGDVRSEPGVRVVSQICCQFATDVLGTTRHPCSHVDIAPAPVHLWQVSPWDGTAFDVLKSGSRTSTWNTSRRSTHHATGWSGYTGCCRLKTVGSGDDTVCPPVRM